MLLFMTCMVRIHARRAPFSSATHMAFTYNVYLFSMLNFCLHATEKIVLLKAAVYSPLLGEFSRCLMSPKCKASLPCPFATLSFHYLVLSLHCPLLTPACVLLSPSPVQHTILRVVLLPGIQFHSTWPRCQSFRSNVNVLVYTNLF